LFHDFARQDARNLCSGWPNLGTLQLMPEARRDRLADFWAKRARLRDRYLTLIEEAGKASKLVDLPGTVTDLVFGAVEATMTWYSGDHDGRSRRHRRGGGVRRRARHRLPSPRSRPPAPDGGPAAGHRPSLNRLTSMPGPVSAC